jgi:hypothetical protein
MSFESMMGAGMGGAASTPLGIREAPSSTTRLASRWLAMHTVPRAWRIHTAFLDLGAEERRIIPTATGIRSDLAGLAQSAEPDEGKWRENRMDGLEVVRRERTVHVCKRLSVMGM